MNRVTGDRGDLAVETLLKLVLGLVAFLLVLRILGYLIGGLAWLLGPFFNVVLLAVALVIVLWLLDSL